MSDNIKDYREKELKAYIISCGILIYLVITNDIELFNGKKINDLNIIIESTLISMLISSFIYICDGLLSSEVKNLLVFMYKLPAENIFTEGIQNCNDARIDKSIVHSKYKNIYDNIPKDRKRRMNYENSNWYRIYSKHKNDEIIKVSQRDYLLLRDIAISNIAICISYIILSINRVVNFNFKAMLLFGLLYVLTMIGTHFKAKRFCFNVIACDLVDIQEE